MILVTGATGNVGQHVVSLLSQKGQSVRALTRNTDSTLKSLKNVTIVQGDFDDVSSLSKALDGVDKVVLISPAHKDMIQHQLNVVNAAVTSGVRKIVKLSGLGAGPDAPIRLPKSHYAIESNIIDTGLKYAFVRPNLFMQVLLGSKDSISNQGAIYAPAGKGKISFTDTRDVADLIVANVLNDNGNTIHEITGPEAFTYSEVAELISRTAGREVKHIDVTPDVASQSMLDAGMQPWLVKAFLELFDIYRDGHGSGLYSSDFKAVTGKTPRSLAAFVKESFSTL